MPSAAPTANHAPAAARNGDAIKPTHPRRSRNCEAGGRSGPAQWGCPPPSCQSESTTNPWINKASACFHVNCPLNPQTNTSSAAASVNDHRRFQRAGAGPTGAIAHSDPTPVDITATLVPKMIPMAMPYWPNTQAVTAATAIGAQ